MIYVFQISSTTIDDNGNDKICKEWYATEKFNTFSEVENYAMEHFDYLTDLDVIAIKRCKVQEIANQRTDANDLVWEAIVKQTFDIEGVKKVRKYRILLFATTFDKAKTFIAEYIKQGYDDMELMSLKETNILDVV